MYAPSHGTRVLVGSAVLLLFLSASVWRGQIPSVSPTLETEPVPTSGDAADDVTIWVHPTSPELSLLIGTDKKAGVAVYDLAGKQLQFLPDGRMNNVDIRSGFRLSGKDVALVTSVERKASQMAIYAVSPEDRRLTSVAARPISLGTEPLGSCMYKSRKTGDFYFFCTSKEGQVRQWRLFPAKEEGAGVDAELVRSLPVRSESEGCVADDENGWLFVAEEDAGIWRYGAEPGDGETRVLVDSTGEEGHLHEDVEGLTIYYAKDGGGYLLASSQGSNTYEVYERRPPHQHVFGFRIGPNPERGIDAVSETDGIDVTNQSLGEAFPDGAFVVHDGANAKPEANQNFKLVPWKAIASAATPPLITDPNHRAR
jgi:3-phytase